MSPLTDIEVSLNSQNNLKTSVLMRYHQVNILHLIGLADICNGQFGWQKTKYIYYIYLWAIANSLMLRIHTVVFNDLDLTLVAALTCAPFSSSRVAISVCPSWDARCKGLTPCLVNALVSAPYWSSAEVISVWFFFAAMWRGV